MERRQRIEIVVPSSPVEVAEGNCCSNKSIRQNQYNSKNEIQENFLKTHDEVEEEAAMKKTDTF